MPALQRATHLLLAVACLASHASGVASADNVTLVAQAAAADGAEPILSGLSTSRGSNATVWAVPLREGPLLPLDYVATCERLGMKPVCEGGPDCEWADDRCVALQIEEANCGHPLRGLQQRLAASGGQQSLEGLCAYEGVRTGGWASGACFPSGGRRYVSGNHAAGTRRVACVGPVGAVVEVGFSLRAGKCLVDGNCVSSPSQLGTSDSLLDGSGCLIVALQPGILKVQYFQTSGDADVLTVRGKPYSGDHPPNGLSVQAGDVLAWTTEGILVGDLGNKWKICLEPQPQTQTAGSNDQQVQKLTQEVTQDHKQEAALQHDLEVARAKVAAEEKASADASSRGQRVTEQTKEQVQKLKQQVQELKQEVQQGHVQEATLRHDLDIARARAAAAEEEEKASAHTSSQALLIKKEQEVQKLNDQVKQDHEQEASLRHDLRVAEARAAVEARAVAQARAVAEAKAAAEAREKEKFEASNSSQGLAIIEKQEAEAHLQKEEAQLQGSLFTDAMALAVLTSIVLVLLLAVCAGGALLFAQRRGRLPWQQNAKGPMTTPLLGDAAESTASGGSSRTPSIAPIGVHSGPPFEPRVTVVDYCRSDGTRAKCVRVEAPGCHMLTGCRTIHGSVKELGGAGVHLRLVKEHDLPEDLGYLEDGFVRDAAGIWEKTLNFEDGPWQVQEKDRQSGGAVDLHGIWQVHLVRSLPSRSFAVCPHVDMSALDVDMEDVECAGGASTWRSYDQTQDLCDDGASSVVASYSEVVEEPACSLIDPNTDTGSASTTSVLGSPDRLRGGRSEEKPNKHSLQHAADRASLIADLRAHQEPPALLGIANKAVFEKPSSPQKPSPEKPAAAGLHTSRSGSSLVAPKPVLIAGEWRTVASSK